MYKARFLLTLVLVNGLRELIDGGWNLEALEKNALLSLNTDVLGPFDKTGEVADWLDVTTDSEVLGALLEEALSSIFSLGVSRNSNFLSLRSFLNLILNHR